MSALGDYVHLLGRNYQKYGVSHKDSIKRSYNYQTARNFLNKKLEQVKPVKEETIQTLSRRLQANTDDKMTQAQLDWKSNQQKLIDAIYTLLYEQSKKVTGIKKQYDIARGQAYSKVKGKKQAIRISSTSQWASSLDHKDLMKKRVKAQNLYRDIMQLINKINSTQGMQSEKDLQKLIQKYEQYAHITPNGEVKPTLAQIQEAIGESRYNGVAGQIGGAFGEMFVAACDDTAGRMAQNEFYNFLRQSAIGNKRSEILIEKDNIYGQSKDFLNTSQTDDGFYSLGRTQDKVDVQIKVNDEDVFANVKSYTVKNGTPNYVPHLQEVGLLSTLVYLNNQLENFGNHWLNLHAAHEDINFGSFEADEIVQKEIAFEALVSGNPLKVNIQNANTFVYINRATGDVFVRSVSDLLLHEFQRFSMNKNIASIHLKNIWHSTWEQRIYDILNQVHQIKISVSLRLR